MACSDDTVMFVARQGKWAVAGLRRPHVVGAVNRREFERHQRSKHGCHCRACELYLQALEPGARGDAVATTVADIIHRPSGVWTHVVAPHPRWPSAVK